jgi:hypothetical protein
MDKIKKALGLGDPTYKHDDDFDVAIQRMRMRMEQEAQMKQMEYDRQRQMMNSAQNVAHQGNPYLQQEAIQGSGYQSGWNDPRAMMNARPISREEALVDSLAETNQVMKRLHEKIERTEKKVEMLTGFYTWITEVYPEIAAQHKAMRDLYEAANSGETQTEAGP